MNIAIISDHASPINAIGGTDSGGQNVYVAQMARHLVQLGHTVDVFTRKDSDSLPLIMELDGYRLINVPAGPEKNIPKEDLFPYMKEFLEFMLSFISSTHDGYDVIHSNFWMSGWIGAELKKRLNIPFAVTFHALGKIRRIHQGANDKFSDERFTVEERIVQEADLILAECPQDYDDLVNLYNASETKISIIPCGFDPSEIHPVAKTVARKIIGIETGVDLILHLGRMVPRKGAANVINGFAHYLKDARKKAKLMIVGGESETPDPLMTPEIGRLLKMAKEEGVADHVIFTGQRQRHALKYYFSAADVFVTTPWYEPFGITPIEAMACGTPVIGSSVGGIKYTVRHGVTGLLIPPEKPQELKAALNLILKDYSLKSYFSRKSVERANKHFRWEFMAKKFDAAIKKHIFNGMNNVFDNDVVLPMNIEGVQNANANTALG